MYCMSCGAAFASNRSPSCARCGAPYPGYPVASSAAAVLRGSEILLVRRAAEPWLDAWDIPGGFCEPGEHPVDTARREVREEAGIEIAVLGLLGMWVGRYDPAREAAPAKRSLSIYYVASCAETASLRPDHAETSEVRWFPLDSPPERLAFPRHNAPVLERLRSGWLR